MITAQDKSEAEAFLNERCGANPSHATLAEECARLRQENERNKSLAESLLREKAELVESCGGMLLAVSKENEALKKRILELGLALNFADLKYATKGAA